MSDPWEDAMIEKPTTKTTAPVSVLTKPVAPTGMVWTAGGWRPADTPAHTTPITSSTGPKPAPKPASASQPAPAVGVSAAYARSMASLNNRIAHTTAMDSHGARDLSAEADAVHWSGVARQLKEQEKQDKMAKFNGYHARGGGYVRR